MPPARFVVFLHTVLKLQNKTGMNLYVFHGMEKKNKCLGAVLTIFRQRYSLSLNLRHTYLFKAPLTAERRTTPCTKYS